MTSVAAIARKVNETTLELDSHADTSVLGAGALIIADYNEPVNVQGYDSSLGTRTFSTVSGVIGWTRPDTGETFHLVVHQAIHIPTLDHHLLCPMQCRIAGHIVNECPRFLDPNPTDLSHCISARDEYGKDMTIPLRLMGVTSVIDVSVVSRGDYTSGQYARIELTDKDLRWEPGSADYAAQEESHTNTDGGLIPRPPSGERRRFVINEISASTCVVGAVDVMDDENYATVLDAHAHVGPFDLSCRDSKSDSCPDLFAISELRNTSNRFGNIHSKRKKMVDAETLAKRWGIPIQRARKTVDVTTQRGVRTTLYPSLSRRYPTNDRMLRYRRLPYPVFSDTMFAGTKSRPRGNKCAQVYSTSFGWTRFHPLKTKSEAHESLSLLFKRDGVPPRLITDNAQEEQRGEFGRKCREADCHLVSTEPYSPWQNMAEGAIKEVKKASTRKMIAKGSPKPLWDYCGELMSRIRSHTSNDALELCGEVPETVMSGQTADISNLCEFDWYDWVMFVDTPSASFPDDRRRLGRYLGPAPDVGSEMTYRVLAENGHVLHRTTIRHLTPEELASEVHEKSRKDFDAHIYDRLGAACQPADFPEEALTPECIYYEGIYDEDEKDQVMGSPDDELDPTPEAGDNFVNVEIMLPRGPDDEMALGRVTKRARDKDGNPIGTAGANPILDTRQYIVQFADGHEAELAANVIATHMFAQCDPDGNQYLLLDSIVDYRRSTTALTHADQKTTRQGRVYYRRSTAGWQLCCQWKDGSTSWQKLADLKESHPIEVAEYAVAQGLDSEPAFNWWVPHVIKKRAQIISLVKKRSARYLKKTHKFGVKLPRTVEQAKALDKANGNTFWQDAIAKEMKDVKVAFKILEEHESVPIGYQHIRCHMIFDVKMEDFRRKARLVAGGHMTDTPATMTYASVVSRESVRLGLMLAALNDLEVKCGDVLNAYVTAPVTEKIWTTLGPEFGVDQGKKAIIVRALYGLKSSGAAFRAHLCKCMKGLGYEPCLADPDLWFKAESRPVKDQDKYRDKPYGADDDSPDDQYSYYSYILCYVDDIMVIHHDARSVLDKIDKYFTLKPSSIGDPDIYLGAKIKKMEYEDGSYAWAMSASKYVQEAVRNCKTALKEEYGGKYSLPKSAPNPLPVGYKPESDVSEPLNPEMASYYQSLIGIMRWMVELGRVDIAVEVSMLSSHNAYPREGHFEAVLHIMSYLSHKHNSRLAMDASTPKITRSRFARHDWTSFYGDVEEAIPSNAPPARGRAVTIRMMVDSDHAGDQEDRRSRTGFMIFVQMSLINWLSKKQSTVERAVFGSEFVAMTHGVETLRGLRYKLRMMGVPIDGPTFIFGDNMSVIHNTSKPESTLKKKSLSICYHAVREAVAMGECLVAHIPTKNNLADLLTKILSGNGRRRLINRFMFDLYDHHDFEEVN